MPKKEFTGVFSGSDLPCNAFLTPPLLAIFNPKKIISQNIFSYQVGL